MEPWYARAGAVLVSDNARFIAFAVFMVLVALMGGGSRADIQSLVILRPAAILFLAYALFCITAAQIRQVKVPLLIVGGLMLLALLQLMPLPAVIWTNLPHREPIAEASALTEIGDVFRPLSLDPNRTWNAFFALFVPLSAICLAAIQAEGQRQRIVPLLLSVGLLSAAFGFLQAIGGEGLKLYEVTHRGYPTGLFANKNHHAVLLLWSILAACWIAARADSRGNRGNTALGGAIALIVIAFTSLILTGSRAGLLLSLPVLALCGWLLLRTEIMTRFLKQQGRRARLVLGGAAALVLAPLVLVFSLLATSGRVTAVHRLFEKEVTEELRWTHLQMFVQMAEDFMPLGSGFGSFESVFRLYEPAETLSTRYMNQAHNEPMQLIIEGGLPALAILALALLWIGRACWQLWSSRTKGARAMAAFFAGSIALWLAASLVDYPLRTPLAAMLVATLTAQLSFLSTSSRLGLPDKTGAKKDHPNLTPAMIKGRD